MKEMAAQLWRGITRQVIVQHLLSMVVFVLVAIAATGRSAAAPAPLGCDFNSNGVCDAADYTLWRNHLGEPTEAGINFGGDGGNVGLSDYQLWKENFGVSVAGGGAIAAASGGVPEPASWMLAASAVMMLAMRRR